MKNYIKYIKIITFTLICFLIIDGCYYGIEPEIVMSKGMEIIATNSEGTIMIIAGEGYERIYKWDNCIRKVTHFPRRYRWYGSKGIYYPVFNCKECNGINIIDAEEGQQHFDNIYSAIEWIKSIKWLEYVYRNDGLVVGWETEFHTLNVRVWQILINSEKPSQIEGSSDSSIIVRYLTKNEADEISANIPPEGFRYPFPEFPMLVYLFGIPILVTVSLAIALIIHHKKISWHIAVLIVCFVILRFMMISLLGDYFSIFEYILIRIGIPMLLVLGLGILMWRKK